MFVFSLLACASLDPASPALGEASTALFAAFDSPEVGALVADLDVALRDDLDLTGDLDDRAVTLPILDAPGVDGAPAALDLQVPVAVGIASPFELDEHLDLTGVSDRACLEPDSTVFTRRAFLTERDCFLDGGCDRLDTSNDTRKKSPFSDITYTFRKDHRVVALPDGRAALVARVWTDRAFAGKKGNNSLDQIYALEVWVEPEHRDENVAQFYALWSSATLPGVGDDAYAALVRRGIEASFSATDTHLSGAPCDR